MLIFRAISEDGFGWQNKNINELFRESNKEEYFKYLYKHLTKGSFYSNNYWTSFSKSFIIAYNYSKPIVYRGNKSNKLCPRNVKIRKTNIIACEFDASNMLDITNKNSPVVQKYCTGRAYTYGKSNEEVVVLGKVEEFVEFTLFQGDLIYILSRECKYNQESSMHDIIDSINMVEDKLELSLIERIVYELLYNSKKNLYEIVAPLYYSNNIDIKYIYGVLFDILKSILTKGIRIIDSSINIDNKILELLRNEMYESELNFICLKYTEYEYSNENCKFGILLEIYKDELKSLNNFELIDKELSYLINDEHLLGCSRCVYMPMEYPLYLYIPRNEEIVLKDYLRFDEKRDLLFHSVQYRTERKNPQYYGNFMETMSEDSGENRKYRYMPNGAYYGYSDFQSNICKFISEIYIPDSYVEIEQNTFALVEYNHLDGNDVVKICYPDLLVRVFGGNNLGLIQQGKYFKNRLFIKEIR